MTCRSPAPVEKPDEQGGLVWPTCGCEHFAVFYPRRARVGQVVRSRECRHFGARIIMFERVVC